MNELTLLEYLKTLPLNTFINLNCDYWEELEYMGDIDDFLNGGLYDGIAKAKDHYDHYNTKNYSLGAWGVITIHKRP